MYGQPTNWTRRLCLLGVLAGIAYFFAAEPIRRALATREFPDEQIREYEFLFDGWFAPEPPGSYPLRSGKVIVIRPSTQLVYLRATTYAMHWTSISPDKRATIAREDSPARIHAAWFYLDDSIRAMNPDEVDTVILVHPRKRGKRDDEVASVDKNPWNDYKDETVLLVYDRRSGRFLGGYIMVDSVPPSQETTLGKQVAEVIEQMPLRSY